MKVKDWIKEFSHNNEMRLENKDHYSIRFYFRDGGEKFEDKIMDWYLPYSTLRDCDVIGISQVLDREKGLTRLLLS